MNLNATLFAQMIVFLILAWFTTKFVWPPLINALDERSKKIADGIIAAEKSKAELETVQKQISKELTQARSDGQRRIAEAEKYAKVMAEKIKSSAQFQAELIINRAKIDAEQQIVKAREKLSNEISALVINGVEQILKREVDKEANDNLLNQLKSEL
ncbi:MAG: F0F1 ATP synthase subunit B [Burkholderia sp.]|nr:F0F1 ATP synthase subunit B [Burkholderia sp.]